MAIDVSACSYLSYEDAGCAVLDCGEDKIVHVAIGTIDYFVVV